MTVNIEYEAEKQLGIPYEEIINEVVCASLDYEGCPYEAEVNVVLTDNEETTRSTKSTAMWTHRRMYYHSQCWSTIRHQILNT